MILSIQNINKFYNGNQILENVNFTIEDRDRIGLVGVNGCGKSTLLKIITKIESFDKINGIDSNVDISTKTTIGFLKQNSGLDNNNTIKTEMLSVFSHLIEISERMRELEKIIEENTNVSDNKKLDDALQEYASKSAYFETHEGYIIDVKIKTILNGMGFENLEDDRLISTLSGGEKTRLALAKLLLENPNLLILDEPTNHLDFKTLLWLEDYLKNYKGALLIVSHDRYFLDKICNRICEIERRKLTSFKGDYSSFLVQKEMQNERLMKEYERQQKQVAELEDYIQKNKVRASTSNMAKSREKQLEKIDLIEKPLLYNKTSKIKLEYDIVPPKEVLNVNGINISVGEGALKKQIITDFDLNVLRGEKVAIIGSNGIGKSTVLKAIQNIIPHNKGSIDWAKNVKISYFDQESTRLNFNSTVIEEFHKHCPRDTEQYVRDTLAKVLLNGENVYKNVGVISGGERAKLCFAIMMNNRGNVLVLDEPTNHLDLNTKEVLEEALYDFDQTIIFVSHDRYLLNKIATRIVEITPDAVNQYKGNFDFYLEKKQEQDLIAQKEIDQKKIEKQNVKAKENKVKVYRTKEQRAQEVKRKKQIKDLEKEIENLQNDVDGLEEKIKDPDIYSDYQKMNEFCLKIDELKKIISDKYDEWILLSE